MNEWMHDKGVCRIAPAPLDKKFGWTGASTAVTKKKKYLFVFWRRNNYKKAIIRKKNSTIFE